MASSHTKKIAIAVCTFNRNEALATLLEAILVSIRALTDATSVGVVIVDDSTDGKAREVADRFRNEFELGLVYKFSGKQNISLARNLAIETASGMSDWTVMIDDDCEPVVEWLEELLTMQKRTGADVITGPMIRRVPPGSPRWLTEEPFLELGHARPQNGAEMEVASTFNSMISSQWLKQHPETRFDPSLGKIGGEDMVFYRSARAQGLRIRYAERACVYENEPPSRANLAYQLRLFFWHGNSSYVASVNSGTHPIRVLLHGLNSLQKALTRPLLRIFKGESIQWRYSVATMLHAVGKIIGVFGVTVRHK